MYLLPVLWTEHRPQAKPGFTHYTTKSVCLISDFTTKTETSFYCRKGTLPAKYYVSQQTVYTVTIRGFSIHT